MPVSIQKILKYDETCINKPKEDGNTQIEGCTQNNSEYFYGLVYLLRFIFSIIAKNTCRNEILNKISCLQGEIQSYINDDDILKKNGIFEYKSKLKTKVYSPEIYHAYRDNIITINYWADNYAVTILSEFLKIDIYQLLHNRQNKINETPTHAGDYILVDFKNKHYRLIKTIKQ